MNRYPLTFTGHTGEYFRIWIVNLCLTVLTLGIYGPWAKVRARKYFYANLVLDGSSFSYDADPKRILIGRLVVLALAGALALLQAFEPTVGAIASFVWLPAMPWLVTRSLAFHRRCSSYRGVRFGFTGKAADVAKLMIGGGLAFVGSLGLAYPWLVGRWQRLQVANSRFGGVSFAFRPGAGPYYRAFGAAALAAIACAVAVALGGAALSFGSAFAASSGAAPSAGASAALGAVALLAGYAAALAVIRARLVNLMYGNASLGDLRFESSVRARDLVRIYTLGLVAIVLSAGLALPWLLVRVARYRAEHTQVIAPGDLGSFTQAAEQQGVERGALAEEAADFFDFDFGL